MSQIGKWGGHKFKVSSNIIRGFTDLSITSSSETKEKTSGKQKYVTRKKSNPTKITVKIELNAFTGCKVRTEAIQFANQARKGKKSYFYIGGKKLVKCKLMLTSASVSEVDITSNGTWTRAEVTLTLNQCGKYGKSASSKKSNKNSKKASVKKKAVTSSGSSSRASSKKKTSSNAVTKALIATGNKSIVGTSLLITGYVASKALSDVKGVISSAKLNRTSTAATTSSKSPGQNTLLKPYALKYKKG